MQIVQKYIPFFLSALLMCVVLYIIYPHYQYYIDPDGTAYLTISKRYATGDYQRAINGYWSPWSCWLTALLIKTGLSPIPASIIINAIGATGFLYISQSFFLKFNLTRRLQWLMCITLAFFLCYAVFAQSFDDLWECFFLLSTLRIILSDRFKEQPVLWIAMGFIGTLAYFAKAYSFPFFILNTICCTYFICKDDKAQWIKISATAIGVMVVCGLPWIWLLHNKYGIWTTSTAGTLNMSWYLEGHPHWKEGINLLIPPGYNDSPYYWEDPWLANGATPHFWNSASLLWQQIWRGGYHVVLFIIAALQLSVFFPLIVIICLSAQFFKKATINIDQRVKVIMTSFLLFPLGYFLINFEARYLWYMVPLSMALGAILLMEKPFKLRLSYKALSFIFPLSYLIVPASGLYQMYGAGKIEFDLAQKMKSSGIHGSFTGNVSHRFMERLAYFSDNQYYYILPFSDGRTRTAGIYNELTKYKVNYYIHYKTGPTASIFDDMELCNDSSFVAENAKHINEVRSGDFSPLNIYIIAHE